MGRKLGHGHGASLVREAYPGHILFENHDNYLRGNDWATAKGVLGLECDGATAVGFDGITLSIYLKQLLAKGLKVGMLRGNTAQAINIQKAKASHRVASTLIGLAPKLLSGKEELDCLERCLSRQSSF